jgi:hypothetical protein
MVFIEKGAPVSSSGAVEGDDDSRFNR